MGIPRAEWKYIGKSVVFNAANLADIPFEEQRRMNALHLAENGFQNGQSYRVEGISSVPWYAVRDKQTGELKSVDKDLFMFRNPSLTREDYWRRGRDGLFLKSAFIYAWTALFDQELGRQKNKNEGIEEVIIPTPVQDDDATLILSLFVR